MKESPTRLEIVDFSEMALSADPLEGAVIAGRGADGKPIELYLSGHALARLEAFLARANLEQAKHHSSH
ncbi:hypothetical protein [Bosea sp. BK604]|uniref:hypothetical protein n=1 Tax=Bosea sp. BK604 TaxID=2512180 RepID=UPI00104CC88B|nr:hypothetical protein [Bosea sp. BK604]TCR65658.1 hypothetical protein EV560_105421 [Bosea sp. BK604]